MDDEHDGADERAYGVVDARTELLPLLLAGIPFCFSGLSATRRETYTGTLAKSPHQLVVYKWPGDRDRWDLLLSFRHPDETHLTVLTVEQPKAALEQRVIRLLREQRVKPRCPFCHLAADQKSGVAYHVGSESPL